MDKVIEGVEKLYGPERLLEDTAEFRRIDSAVFLVAGHEEHPDVGPLRTNPNRELIASHDGHHHIGQQDVYLSTMFLAQLERSLRMIGHEHSVAGLQ